MIQLTVNLYTEATVIVDCDADETVTAVKQKIHEKSGIPPQEQRLLVLNNQMNDGQTLRYYNIVRGERTITVRPPLEGEL